MNNTHSSETESQADQSDSSQKPPPRSWAEQVSFGIAALIVLTLISAVSYLWWSKRQPAPANPVIARTEPIQQLSGQFHVPFELTNEGDDTAESVQVIAELRIKGEVVETGEQQIDFLSSHETEAGMFIFSQDPRRGKLVIRVASYKQP
jgi:uncharacterized protein (TIGR02588 family)